MYMFINVPAISVMEWHPFSASCPCSARTPCLLTLLCLTSPTAWLSSSVLSRTYPVPAAITSAPGDPYVSVHVRDAGDWTHALYEYMLLYAKSVEVRAPRCKMRPSHCKSGRRLGKRQCRAAAALS